LKLALQLSNSNKNDLSTRAAPKSEFSRPPYRCPAFLRQVLECGCPLPLFVCLSVSNVALLQHFRRFISPFRHTHRFPPRRNQIRSKTKHYNSPRPPLPRREQPRCPPRRLFLEKTRHPHSWLLRLPDALHPCAQRNGRRPARPPLEHRQRIRRHFR